LARILEIFGVGAKFRVPPLGGHNAVSLCGRPPKGGTLNGIRRSVYGPNI
jgi:hypothetical protein